MFNQLMQPNDGRETSSRRAGEAWAIYFRQRKESAVTPHSNVRADDFQVYQNLDLNLPRGARSKTGISGLETPANQNWSAKPPQQLGLRSVMAIAYSLGHLRSGTLPIT